MLNSTIIVKTWEHGFAKQCNISKLGMPSLEQTNQKLVCQVLTIIFLWSCLGRPRHENHNSSLGLMLKLITSKGFKTWKAKSWIVQSLSRLGNMELKKTFQSLAMFDALKAKCWSNKLCMLCHFTVQLVKHTSSQNTTFSNGTCWCYTTYHFESQARPAAE